MFRKILAAAGALALAATALTGAGFSPAVAATATCSITGDASNNWEPQCGPYDYAPITPNWTDTVVGLNGWNCGNSPGCGPLSATVTDPGHWTLSADEPAGNTAVMMYPSTYQNWWNPNAGGEQNWLVSKTTAFNSTFSETMPTTSGTVAWSAYDMFIDNSGTSHNEMMVQTQNVGGCISCSQVAGRATFANQKWVLRVYGGEMIWDIADASGGDNESSGTVHLGAMLKWLQSHGFIGPASTFNAIGFGWEVCSTGGVPETFSVNSLGMTLKSSTQ